MPKTDYEVIRSHQETLPVSVGDIAAEFGIRLYDGLWRNGESGQIVRDRERGGRSGFMIVANEQHPRTRRRFTIAHEIAHYVLHRTKIGDGVTDDPLYRSRLGGSLEMQANEFAAWILMPWDLLRSEAERGANSVEALAEIFDVSRSTMAVRLRVPYETE